jgi:hypothetical protein
MCGRRSEDGLMISGAIVCGTCVGELQIVIEKRRAEGKPVEGVKIDREGFHKTYSGIDYLIRDVPAELINKALRRADVDGDSLRDLTVKAMKAYLMEKGGK